MKSFNLELTEHLVGTQFNDMKGVAAIDGFEMITLCDLCEDHGIDPKQWFLIGLRFADGEPVGRSKVRISAYLVEKENEHESFDQIAARIQQKTAVTVHKKNFDLPYNKLGYYIKRLDMLVFSEMIDHIRQLDIITEE